MIVTPWISARIALILAVGAVLQLSFFSEIDLFGASPELMPVLIVCLGLLGGAVIGAVCGFAAGLLIDSALLQTLGVSSLTLLAVGYLAGRYREGFTVTSRWTPPLLAGGLTLVATTGFALIHVMLGVDSPVSLLVVRDALVKSVFGFLLAFPVYPLLRWILRPALVDAPGESGVRTPIDGRFMRSPS
jgi:rod shape-determining protein MreD